MDSDALAALLTTPIITIGSHAVPVFALVLAGLLLLLLILWLRARRAAREALELVESREAESSDRLDAVLKSQSEITGRMQTMAEIFGARQADLTRTLAERFDGLTSRVGQSIIQTTTTTNASLSALSERLAVIDRAQGEIRNLAGEVVRLQDILANKQTRGAFGEGRMQAIVADALPSAAYSFQATLSNGKRPDCLINMPNGAPSLAIDAKFPLEAYSALRDAESDDARDFAASRLRRDMDVHVKAIAGKYLIPGETQDTAFLFVPSETIFAELHERFEDVVQKAYRARVVIVSPSLLLLSIQVVQAILKDARMRAEAGRIQQEVRHLTEDLTRLDARVAALKTHFGQAGRDVDQILVSTEKLIRRGERIEAVELGEAETLNPVRARVPAE
ncbi:DNA recombination protein RmuC [Aurantimonas sp. C2-6-R+9]|uniref:DNA recombination protein RmuC n=1 Tax=unclassified Aurantimonas TaxID=2638230 RepID=UPI002E178C4D|nr:MULTISPECIES: DNA recombination protein RmuC [unclassified Aurantimonas]MEC5292066.1 DNA recombination protein RmuC [Aurantimonas sp. C2-3-R2]MEC5382180.1 DNA recombination protein RmuC [Aurantimonas sp. C2-6-R+9]MEC5413116.1 DNA recombination protein RmuC [Aurantimonas sp. C2-4-R8]